MSKLCSSKFWVVHSAVRMHDLLLCCESSRNSCSTNNANLDKKKFDMFYKTDCCAAVHGRIWMNNVPNESRIIMLSCTEISFVIYFFRFWKFFESNSGFLFFFFLHTLYNGVGKQSEQQLYWIEITCLANLTWTNKVIIAWCVDEYL